MLETPILSVAVTSTVGTDENHPPGSGGGVKEGVTVGAAVSGCGDGAEPGKEATMGLLRGVPSNTSRPFIGNTHKLGWRSSPVMGSVICLDVRTIDWPSGENEGSDMIPHAPSMSIGSPELASKSWMAEGSHGISSWPKRATIFEPSGDQSGWCQSQDVE